MASALVLNGSVIQIEGTPFPVNTALTWVAIPAGETVAVGYSYAAGVFAPPPAPPAPTLAQQASAMIGTGLTITSTSTPALDGTYSVGATAQQQINAEVTSILLNDTFADGSSTIEWLDVTGASHAFTIAQFKTLATAIAAFVSACVKVMNGQVMTLPATTATIA